MTAADAPPNRKHLAAMLKVFARSGSYFGIPARTELIQYVEICEDTIEHQAAMLAADGAELANRSRIRRDQDQVIAELGRECDRLRSESANLRVPADAALPAGMRHDDADLRYVRQQLEQSS
jgi:hypothetical protein